MWTPATRRQHSRYHLRYETDLTDAEWALIEPLMPTPKLRGRPRGYDAGKKVKGRKRQVMVDTDGRALILEPQPANVQDRDGAPLVLRLSRRSFPFITKAFADMGFAGEGPAIATSITIEIVRKPADQIGFAVHPRRWVVERFFAWISRNRRLWKDPEATLAAARAFLYAASVMLLTRRLARLS